jgi:glucosamine--fructose-6-phosphate aminotransferase (isomerizing)
MRGRVDFAAGEVTLGETGIDAETARGFDRMVAVACGTSFYSAQIGKFYMESLARLTTEFDYASEYRYRDPLVDARTAVLAITQSGETVDTLAAMTEARRKGGRLYSIVNATGSQAMRMADGCLTMNAGPEVGVASTKAFTTSILDQLLLALWLGQLRGTLSEARRRGAVDDLARLPGLVGQALATEDRVRALAQSLAAYEDFLYVGRGLQYPVALEGALKLKEISYLHAEGYPAGEMKHGPIALLDERVPVVAIVLKDALYEKMLSQVAQAKARGARVIALATEGDADIATKADDVVYLPETPPLLAPIVSVVPLQLLAYHAALARGCDVDQPRNLAKSVTVE